jgi:hypothetical protein
VVEVAAISVFESRGEPLEDASVETHRVTAGAERQPVQLDRAGNGRRNCLNGSAPRQPTSSIGNPARRRATNPPATSAAPLRSVAFDRTACWQR